MEDAEMSCSHTPGEKVIKLKHKWTIDDFSQRKETLRSADFWAINHKDEKWCIEMYPLGNKEESKGYVSIFLYRKSAAEYELTTRFNCALMNSQNKVMRNRDGSNIFTTSGAKANWGWSKAILRTDLLKEIATDDILIIVYDISYKIPTSTTKAQESGECYFELKIPQCKLIENLGGLLENENFSDVILEIGDIQLKAHKNILAAQSPVFAAMFQHAELAESKNNLVKIEDIEPDVLKEMLKFMYSGESPNLATMALSLLAAADKYALERLKIMCENSLCSSLTVENAAKTLYLADLHSAPQLKRHVIKYICSNPSIIETEEWKQIPFNKNLLNEIMQVIFKKARNQ